MKKSASNILLLFNILFSGVYLCDSYAGENSPNGKTPISKETTKPPISFNDNGCNTGLSALGNALIRTNAAYTQIYGDLETYIIENKEHFLAGGDAIRCAQALAEAFRNDAIKNFDSEAFHQMQEFNNQLGGMGASPGTTPQTRSEVLSILALQIDRLARVLPPAANGNFQPLNTATNVYEQNQLALNQMLQDPSFSQIIQQLRPALQKQAELEYQLLVDMAASVQKTKANLDEYKVALGANALMKIPGDPGELRVWIGQSDYEPDFPTDMDQTSKTLPAVGGTAMVTPYAPTFRVEPQESICMKIHPSGSETRFTLTPTKEGIFKVGADVQLFDSVDCSGAPIPKAATTLKIKVVVDTREVILDRINELWEVFWKKLIDFWAAVLVLLFGLLLFLIRGKLKKWFGYKSE